ncbi:MAG TPA: hypothetical protein VF581_13045 [Flavobacterium sp.]|jgi:antibiotic biosynthesis monooxygenase (ABM) superfamily enzyme
MNTKIKILASLKIWIVIYPSITIFLYVFGETMAPLPLYQKTLLLTLVLLPWIVFIGVPTVTYMINKIAVRINRNEASGSETDS